MSEVIINNERMTVHFEEYLWEGNTAITITCEDGSPYAHVSTNMCDEEYDSDEVFILDDYDSKLLPVAELVEAGFIEPTDRLAHSGYNTYRLYKVHKQAQQESEGE